jgi:carbonic anhydrase
MKKTNPAGALGPLFENNRRWAQQIKQRDPEFFSKLARQQAPKYLWIGCSDSRVPANDIVGLLPGELFVHRNVANLVVHSDLNCLCVLQYAIDVLKVEHVMVCGHYGCGGVAHAMRNEELGMIDNWLRNIKDIYHDNRAVLDGIGDENERVNRLCELNVSQQVANVCHTTIVQHAWRHGHALSVHGFVYDIHDGLLRDLGFCVTGPDQIPAIYRLGG